MCGITGVLNCNGQPVDPVLLEKMLGTLRHRGPDENDIYVKRSIGLGHSRLSIIDLATGRQPMSSSRGNVIVFNGEIFNYIELKEELEGKGHRFVTRSDTEVILRLYEEHGTSCVEELNGQWAFAIWDNRQRRLFLSRDRMGIRPLYFVKRDRLFLFASEIKALLQHPEVSRELDLKALDQVFTFWGTVPPRTPLKAIKELPPGHSMTLDETGVRQWAYWNLDFSNGGPLPKEEVCREELLSLLIDATRLRLRSDVPVGSYLSGGLDSSLVTSIIKRYTSNHLKTFSVAFTDPAFDESEYQEEIARTLGTDSSSVLCTQSDVGEVFPDVVRHTERPLLRTAAAPLYLLSRLVKSHGYKVVLTGEGADEVFGGYDIFKEAKIRRFWGKDLDSRVRPLLLKRLYPYLSDLQSQNEAYLKGFFHVNPNDLENPFFSHLPRWNLTAHLKLFFSWQTKVELEGYDCIQEVHENLPPAYLDWDSFAQAQYLESTLLLPGYILSSQGDRVAMAHSVEGRFPFLDHRVVEFGARLAPRLKMRGLTEKYILKKLAGDLLPTSVVKRPKQPYRAPDAISFFDPVTQRPRFDYVAELLSERQITRYNIFNPNAVSSLVQKVKRSRVIGTRDNMALVGILSTQILLHWLESEVLSSGATHQIRERLTCRIPAQSIGSNHSKTS